MNIKFNKINDGNKNPILIGIKQIKITNNVFLLLSIILGTPKSLDSRLLNNFLDLENISIDIKIPINKKAKIESWAAADMSFIPNHTLKIPSVKVSRAKYSTVPKSDTTSIKTRDNPAIIAGLASGKAASKKIFLPVMIVDSYKNFEVFLKEVLVNK